MIRKEQGITMVEYVLVAALLSVCAIIGISAAGNTATAKFSNINNTISAAGTDGEYHGLDPYSPFAPASTTVYASSYSINGDDGTAEYLAITGDQRTLATATIDGTVYSLTQIEAPHDVSAGCTYPNSCSPEQCGNIKTVEIVDKVAPTSMSYWFKSFNQLMNIQGWDNIDSSSVKSMSSTFSDCSSLASAPAILNSVTNMAYTFRNCSSLTVTPVIPNGVTSMWYTFYNCSSLTTAPVIPNSVTVMACTFYNCSSLTTAPAIPSRVTNMGSTFYNCSSLTTAPAIPNSVTNMYNTFYNCSSLTGNMVIAAAPNSYTNCFSGAASASGASLTVNYTSSATNIDAIIATKTSNVIKGVLVS